MCDCPELSYLFGSLPHQHEALGVGDDLGGIQRLLEIVNEELLVASERLLLWARDNFASTDTLLLDSRQATCKHSLANKSD